ncbi:NADH:flavin oxidoreductase/NADH oxidase-like protein [Xylaria digitata]|nr:NADH:flavin oxidoreductase/NADH oxidase-like protein [Xylaria digitata]
MPVTRYESAPVDISPLAQPLKFEFSGRTAKNRFFKAAMAEGLATWHPTNLEERGIPTKELIELYRRWGENEWGVITTGNIDIELDRVDAVGDMIVTPELAPNVTNESFREIALKPGETISKYAKPREATKEDLARFVDGFSYAAEYLQKAGFDGIELHAAHGYLLSQFLSETSNQRTDEYGGSLRNRPRLVTEIAEAIRRRTNPGFVLGIKLNSVEFQANGLKPAEVKVICETLQETGFDFVELSGGTHEDTGYGGERESTHKREAYFLEFVRDIVPNLTRTRKFLVGGFRTAASMVQALDQSLDGISLGRPAAQEPRITTQILAGKVTGAIKPPREFLVNLNLGETASGSQMLQIAKGLEPFDASDEKAVAAYKRAEADQSARLAADGDKLEVYGYPELTVPEASSHPNGVAY